MNTSSSIKFDRVSGMEISKRLGHKISLTPYIDEDEIARLLSEQGLSLSELIKARPMAAPDSCSPGASQRHHPRGWVRKLADALLHFCKHGRFSNGS